MQFCTYCEKTNEWSSLSHSKTGLVSDYNNKKRWDRQLQEHVTNKLMNITLALYSLRGRYPSGVLSTLETSDKPKEQADYQRTMDIDSHPVPEHI